MFDGLSATILTLAIAVSPKADLDKFLKPRPQTPAEKLMANSTIGEIHQFQNQERARYGLPPFRIDGEMCLIAQRHADWMASTGNYVHSGVGYSEIIHSGPQTARDAVNGWIYSPGHHAIMLSGSTAGHGFATRNGYTYWVTIVR